MHFAPTFGADVGAPRRQGALRVVRLPLRALGPDWQAFAEQNGGSFRSLPDKLRLASAFRLGRNGLRAFEFTLAGPAGVRKIGQCWVMRRAGRVHLGDGLQLLPQYADRWPEALGALLDTLGPGTYEYGWPWSLEPSRAGELAAMPGVAVASVMDYDVHYVDFSDWSSWDEYYRAISDNVRRNVRKAAEQRPSMVISETRGRAAIGDVRSLIALRQETFARLGSHLNGWKALVSCFTQLLIAPRQMVSMVARDVGVPLAGLLGYEFGDAFYYWQGGSVADQAGGGWSLLTTAVKRWYDRHPKGRFILGYFNPDLPGVRREGLLRQRQSLRKRDARTSVITFDYSPPAHT